MARSDVLPLTSICLPWRPRRGLKKRVLSQKYQRTDESPASAISVVRILTAHFRHAYLQEHTGAGSRLNNEVCIDFRVAAQQELCENFCGRPHVFLLHTMPLFNLNMHAPGSLNTAKTLKMQSVTQTGNSHLAPLLPNRNRYISYAHLRPPLPPASFACRSRLSWTFSTHLCRQCMWQYQWLAVVARQGIIQCRGYKEGLFFLSCSGLS